MSRARPRARRLGRVAPALVASGVLHSAVLASALVPWGAGDGRAPRAPAVVLVELPPPRDPGGDAAGLLPAEDPTAALARQVETLTGENRALASRLTEAEQRTAQLEAHHRREIAALQTAQSHLGEAAAALAADRSALAAEVEAERRRAAALETALAARRAAEQAAQDELAATHERLARALSREIAADEVVIERANERLTVAIVDLVLFPSGQAGLTAAGGTVIDRVGAALREVAQRPVLVEGHTDSVPIGHELRVRFPSNWELSAARATAVVKRLIEHGDVAAARLRAVGRADTEPVADNGSEDGRRRNRRVEIILLPPPAARDAT